MEISIRKCKNEELNEFMEILGQAFDEKFSVFFKGCSIEERNEAMVELTRIAYPGPEILGHYLAESKQIVGSIRVIDPTTPNNKRWEPFKYLIKRFGLFKAIRTGLLLEAFITKKVENDEMYIDAIGVGDGFRGKGIGTLLLTEVEKLARQHGLNKLTLYVSCRNELAEALYTRFGFERVSIRKSKIAERLMNIPAFHLMVKVLK